MPLGYCFKDKKKVQMTNTTFVVFKNGRQAWKGKCAICGGNVMHMIPKGQQYQTPP